MATVRGMGTPIPIKAGGDLSLLQWHYVKLNSSGEVIAIAAITDIPFGVLQNAPASGEHASVIPLGSGGSKVALGATLSPGALVGVGATGKAVAVVATNYPAGQLLEGGADGELGEVNLMSLTLKA